MSMEESLPDLLMGYVPTGSVADTSGGRQRSWQDGTADDNSDSNSEGESGQWEEEDEGEAMVEVEPVLCLFCREVTASPELVLKHCKDDHLCDLITWVKQQALPTEDVVRLVNYVRREHIPVEVFKHDGEVLMSKERPWADDRYMVPVHPEDHGLSSLLIWDWDEPDPVAVPFPTPDQTTKFFQSLDLLAGGDRDHRRSSSTVQHTVVDDERNASYFDSYSGFNIHCEMLRDKVRTESYRRVISQVAAGKTVLDIGCGTGVLSCFAAKAGADMVIAVDRADIITYAQEIAQQNDVADKIRFIHGDLDQVRLPVDKVDVIVSEWMGYFLLFEGMLDSVISARDKYLKPGGTMIPSSATLFLTAISDDKDWQAGIGFWDDAYGLKFACLKKHNLRYPSVLAVDPATVVVQSDQVLRAFDLMACSVDDLQFESDVVFIPTKSCNITALIGFFDVGHGPQGQQAKVMFSTSPRNELTHWAQAVFYLDKGFPVVEGVAVNVHAVISKSKEDTRGLRVVFSMATEDQAQQSTVKWAQTYEI